MVFPCRIGRRFCRGGSAAVLENSDHISASAALLLSSAAALCRSRMASSMALACGLAAINLVATGLYAGDGANPFLFGVGASTDGRAIFAMSATHFSAISGLLFPTAHVAAFEPADHALRVRFGCVDATLRGE